MKKQKSIFLQLIIILFITSPAARASMPSSEEILRSVFEKYSGVESYSSDTRIRKTITSGDEVNRFTAAYRIDIHRPNKFSVRHLEGLFARTMVSDGDNMWIYIPHIKKYTTKSAPREFEDALRPSLDAYRDLTGEQFALFFFTDDREDFMDTSRISPPVSEEIDEKLYYIIDVENGGVKLNLRIGQDDFTLSRIEMDATLPLSLHRGDSVKPPQSAEINYIESHDEIYFNREIDPEIFVFTPPEGAEADEDILMRDEPVYPFTGEDIGDFTFTDPYTGEEFSISDFRGRVALICFVNPADDVSRVFIDELAAQSGKIRDVKIVVAAPHGQREELIRLLQGREDTFTGALDSQPYMADSLGLLQLPGALTVGEQGRMQHLYTGYFEGLSRIITEEASLAADGPVPGRKHREYAYRIEGMDLKWNIPLDVSSLITSGDIYALSPAGRLYTISPHGAVADSLHTPKNHNRHQLSGAGGDMEKEFITYREKGKQVNIIAEDGERVSNFSVFPGINTLMPADLNSDGREEIILGLSGLAGLRAVSKDGDDIFTSTAIHNVISLDLIQTDGQITDILAVSGDGSLMLFSPEGVFRKEINTRLIAGFAGAINNSILVSGSAGGNEILKLMDYDGTLKWELILGEDDGSAIVSAALHPHKDLFVCGMRSGRIIVFDGDGNIRARAGIDGLNIQTGWIVFEEVQVNLIFSSRESGIISYAVTGIAD